MNLLYWYRILVSLFKKGPSLLFDPERFTTNAEHRMSGSDTVAGRRMDQYKGGEGWEGRMGREGVGSYLRPMLGFSDKTV